MKRSIFRVFLVAASLLTALPALADGNSPRFFRAPDGALMVEARTCPDAQALRASLSKWEFRLGEASEAKPTAVQESDGGCVVSIEDVAPDFVRHYHGLKPLEEWGNCYGTALAAAGMIPDFIDTQTQAEGLEVWTRSPLCRPVPPGESPQAGDFVSIEWSRGAGIVQPVHAMVYAGDGIVFSKNGIGSDGAMELQPLDAILDMKTYRVNDDPVCRHGDLANLPHWSKCAHMVFYFRCQTMKQWIASRGHPISASVQCKLDAMDELESRARNRAMNTDEHPFADLIAQIRVTAEPLAGYASFQAANAKTALENPALDATERESARTDLFLWQTIGFRAMAIYGGM